MNNFTYSVKFILKDFDGEWDYSTITENKFSNRELAYRYVDSIRDVAKKTARHGTVILKSYGTIVLRELF